MAHHILMIDTTEEEHRQFVSLLEKLGIQSSTFEWLRQDDDAFKASIPDDYDVILAIYTNDRRKLSAANQIPEHELRDFKNRLVSMASHEFRTPLTSIASSAELIEAYIFREDFDNAKRHINRIKKSVHDLNLILADFFTLDKIGKGNTLAVLREMNLPKLIEDIRDEFLSLFKSGQKIQYSHTGPSMVKLDPKLLKVVLHNLLSNAAKFSAPHNDIQVSSTVSPKNILISVSDAGIGIPAEEQGWIFTRFYRARNATNIQGTGLGLFIAKSYVELMGGAINVVSEIEKGTTFNLNFTLSP